MKSKPEGQLFWSFGLLSEVIFGLCFWTLFSEFLPTLWFFPLVRMDLTGYEVLLVALFTPSSLGIRSVRTFCSSNRGLLFLLACVGLASFWGELVVEVRTLMLAFGFSFALLGLCVSFWAGKNVVEREIFGFLFSLILWLCLKYYYVSVDPIFTNPIWNASVLGLTISSSIYTIFFCSKQIFEEVPKTTPKLFSILTGIGFGSLLFVTHWIFSSHGIIPRWIKLNPQIFGPYVILTVYFSILLQKSNWVKKSYGFWLLSILASYFFVESLDFFSALILVLYCSSIWLSTVKKMSKTQPFFSLFSAISMYIILLYGSIITVAYNFVPFGGDLLRERPGPLLWFSVFCIGFGYLLNNFFMNKEETTEKKSANKQKKKFYHLNLDNINIIIMMFIILVSIFIPVGISRNSNNTVEPVKSNLVKSMIWAVHFGYDNEGRSNFESAKEIIEKNEVNVIGLLETDTTRIITKNTDIIEWLSTELNMYSDFGPTTAQNTWGCALISKFPIVESNHILMPSPEGELACLLDAKINVTGKLVNVIVTHFGNTRDVLDRKLQTECVRDLVNGKFEHEPYSIENNIIFLGYLTSPPKSETYKQIVTLGGLKDTAPNEWRRYCEYILYRGVKFEKFIRYDTGESSDTEAQIGHFTVTK